MSDQPDPAGSKQAATQFKPGQSGNPAGRPKGSRNKLGEDFVAALQADFEAHGADTIARARGEDPVAYVKVVASLLPKEIKIDDERGLTNEQLAREFGDAIAALRLLGIDPARLEAGSGDPPAGTQH